MKKIIFILISFLCIVGIVNGEELVSENTNYYIKLNDKVINIKKIYEKDSLEVFFNVNFNKYEISNNLVKTNKFKISERNNDYYENFLYTIIYYCYLKEPSDLNYYYTQILIWQYISGLRITMTNEFGEELNDLKGEYARLLTEVLNHKSKPSFFNKVYNTEIWSYNTFNYSNALDFDIPLIDELDIYSNQNSITIYNKEVGNYKLNFNKDYEQEVYCYENYNYSVFCQSLKGPEDINYDLNYNVYGTEVAIKENLIGVNNKCGDAELNGIYELYLGDELKLMIDNSKKIYVKSNSEYILKDVSNNNSIYNIDNIKFKVDDKDLLIEVDKHVISKNISITVNNNKEYYVYLKSNNELYEILNKSTDLIVLPYGIYYVTDHKDYYAELNVLNDIDEELEIKEEYIEEKDEEEVIIDDFPNPKTGDNINTYIFIAFSCLIFILANYIVMKKLN